MTQLKKPAYCAEELMKFRASIENILSSLENLGRDISAGSWVLTLLVKDKLPTQALEYIQNKVNK